MKVVTAETMQQVDRNAIEGRGIAGLILMENAGKGCAAAIMERYGSSGHASVVAGKGNNGGDGFVVARLLLEQGWKVKVYILASVEQLSGDARRNLDLLPDSVLTFCSGEGMLGQHALSLESSSVIVDALFGTGLKNDLTGHYAEAINIVNRCGRPVVAVDIPSGINGTTGCVMGVAVRADLTVTFALAKRGHVLYPGAEYCGSVRVVDIGIPPDIMEAADGCEYIDAAGAASLLHPRQRVAHKGTCGHALIIAGSTGKTGAAAMAANSAVRAGSGLVSLAVPATLNPILEMKTTEPMTLAVPDGGKGFLGNEAHDCIVDAVTGRDVVAIGPGMSWHQETSDLIRALVSTIPVPMVVDADGLNAISEDTDVLLGRSGTPVVLTPHPGEMARLCGTTVAAVEEDRIRTAGCFAHKYKVHLILKGARTVIAAPDGRVAINGSGNPGMASGGMGDVLTGVLTALLAQGYDAYTACRLGVFVHGHAADMVAAEKGEIGISATDVQERLPCAFKHLLHMKTC